MFDKIVGQEKPLSILKNAITKDKIANSYLFYGNNGIGKFTSALYFGMAINCQNTSDGFPCGVCNSCKKFLNFTHPDFLYLFPTPKLDISVTGDIKLESVRKEYLAYLENKRSTPWKKFFFSKNTEIRIESIRMLEHKINFTPYEAKYKIYIIEDVHKVNIKTENAFLKTLEEPPKDSIIILTTSKPQDLLPTILSRCQKIQFSPLQENTIEKKLLQDTKVDATMAKMIAKIANGNMEKALQLADQGFMEARRDTDIFLQLILEKDNEGFYKFSENFKSSAKNELLLEMINYLIIWVTDIAYIEIAENQVINIDKISLLKDFFRLNPNIATYSGKIISNLEEMQRRLKGHVNQQLVLFEIYFYLTDFFH